MPEPWEIKEHLADPARTGKDTTENRERKDASHRSHEKHGTVDCERTSFFYRPRELDDSPRGLDPDGLAQRAGDTLGDFRIERLIGQGAMGQVWQAEQISLRRKVALKLIRPDRLTPDMLRFFRREGRAGGRLHHPAIVSVHGMGHSEGVHWIAQELVRGECNLHHFQGEFASVTDLPPEYDRKVAQFFLQITEALQFAHESGVVHRDIKPQNILIAENDQPKVTDFGLARIIDEESVSLPGEIKGTPRYMSPEQALGLTDLVGPLSDVFSLGAVLYGALTLQPAFQGSTLASVLHAVTRTEPIRPSKLRPAIDRDLEAICLRALEKRQAARYPSMVAFGADLSAYLEGRSAVARPLGPWGRAGKFVRRNRKWTMAAAVITVMAIGLITLSGAWSSARAGVRSERYKALLAGAQNSVEVGKPEEAESQLRQAEQIRPGSPETHLLRASAAARYSRYQVAQLHIEAAKQLGYDPERASPDSGVEQYYRGIHDLASGLAEQRNFAAKSLERCLELEPDRRAAWYPLYQARVGLGNPEGAIEALTEYRLGLTYGDPLFRLVSALITEQEFRFADAAEELSELDASLDGLENPSLAASVVRALGRVQFLSGDLDASIPTLERAVDLVEEDSASWSTLSLARLGRALEADSRTGAQWAARLESARFAALRAKDLLPRATPALELLAAIEWFEHEGDSTDRLQDLLQDSPKNEIGVYLAGLPPEREGVELWSQHKYAEAVPHFERALAGGAELFRPHLFLGEEFYFSPDPEAHERAKHHFEEARRIWLELADRSPMHPESFFTQQVPLSEIQSLHVLRFALAAKRSDIEFGASAKEDLERLLRERPFEDDAQLLNYVEALVCNVPEAWRDEERANELFARFLERSGGVWDESYNATISNIRRALGR